MRRASQAEVVLKQRREEFQRQLDELTRAKEKIETESDVLSCVIGELREEEDRLYATRAMRQAKGKAQ